MKLRFETILNICLLVGLLHMASSCKFNPSNITVKPKALGVINEILVVSDSNLWHSVVGDTIQDIYGGIYPITHRPEPIFDLRYFSLEDINYEPLRRQLRTYMVVADLSDPNSTTTQMVKEDLGSERFSKAMSDPAFNTSVGKDKWATGQIVIYVFAKGVDALTEALVANFDAISSRINEHDLIQLHQKTYARGENLGLATELKKRYNADIILPTDYKTALDLPNENKLMWFRRDTKYGTMNVIIREYEYTGPELLSPKEAKSRFDAFGIHVTSDRPETYIIINDVDLPLLDYDRTINGNYVKEYRGIWEMENDFFGGSYIGYAFVNQSTHKMLVMDCFIQAPGQPKRDMLQQLDRIAKRVSF